jgi:heptosyltransferase-2
MLIAAPERWDEACFMLPALRAVAATGLKTAVFCQPGQLPLWQQVTGVQAIPIPQKTRDAVAMLSGNWHAALLWEHGHAAVIAARAKVPRRIGPAVGKLTKRLTHPLNAIPGPLDHRVRFYLAAIEDIGIATDRPEFFAPAELSCRAIPNSMLLSPGSDFGPSHEWPLDRWHEFGRAMLDDGLRLSVAATRDGRAAASLAAGLGPDVELLDASSPGDILPQLAAYPWVVAADGSLPHLAAYAGATCITLFGPNDPQWKRPLGRHHIVLRHHVECAPCLMPKCPLDLRCQHELEAAHVIRTVRTRIASIN